MAHEAARRLAAARLEAIDSGDKALGRELYHQLIAMGVQPEAIDSGAVTAAPTAAGPDETAAAPRAPERTVHRKPKAR